MVERSSHGTIPPRTGIPLAHKILPRPEKELKGPDITQPGRSRGSFTESGKTSLVRDEREPDIPGEKSERSREEKGARVGGRERREGRSKAHY